MGKSKAKGKRKRCDNPTGIPSLKEMEENIEFICSDLETGDVDSIIEKLRSPAADIKECAAFNIANMADNASFVTSLIEKKVIRIVGPLLVDRNPAVRHAIAGCLRNLAVCNDYSVCEAMIEQDILTGLVALLLEYKDPWTPTKSPEGVIDSRTEIFLEACNLLWSLCESSDIAVRRFNDNNLVKILLPCLNIDVYGLQIPLAVAQCLHTVGEENKEVIKELSQPLILEQLRTLMVLKPEEPEHVLLKTLSAGIMINILSGNVEHCMNAIIKPIGEVVHSTLSEPITPALLSLSRDITSHKHERSNKYRDEDDVENKLNAVNKSFKTLNYLLQAKQISLEIIANISVNSNDEWEDTCDSSDDMPMETDFEEATTETVDLEMDPVIRDIIVHYNLLQKSVEQIVTPDENVTKVLSGNSKGKGILKRLDTVRCRALLCLNNMVEELAVEDIGGPEKLFSLWISITRLLFIETGTSDDSNIEQLDAITSSMRAVLQKLAKAKVAEAKLAEAKLADVSYLGNLGESDLKGLMDICNQIQEASIKVNIIKSLGIIGSLIANSPLLLQSCCSHIKIIGVFLLEICSKCPNLWVIAESLDSLLDVFAEDHVDCIAVEINLVEKLNNIKKHFVNKVKQQGKFLGEHSVVIKVAKENLIRFIQYKIQMRNT